MAGVLMLSAAGCTRGTELPPAARINGGVLQEMRAAFTQVNPGATRVWILDVGTRPSGSGRPDAGDEYAVVATAWQPGVGPVVSGKFFGAGELFGVFVVDSTFAHVERVLHVFPTRRWHDYQVFIDAVDADSITVLGQGGTFGDEAIGFRFDWAGNGRREFVWTPEVARYGQD
ncbi:MAG: hypothetical protein ACREOU_05220 [Candidatus Eiseniibacteriota bacterium]